MVADVVFVVGVIFDVAENGFIVVRCFFFVCFILFFLN